MRTFILGLAVLGALHAPATPDLFAQQVAPMDPESDGVPVSPAAMVATRFATPEEVAVTLLARARLDADVAAMTTFRPSYPFWRHIFEIPDGSVAFGSAQDGRLLAVFPSGGDWLRSGRWEDKSLESVLQAQRLPSAVSRRRDQVATLLEPVVGRVIHNPTRGDFLRPARRYASFLSEWGAIYERFGVPAEIGLAQVLVESGLDGRIRSEAQAFGFCQWLPSNWERLKRLAHHVIEGYNQTTQAPYCAAHLAILATRYGTFIPALSDHHSGGVNVGRIVINGGRLGGGDVREQYLLGSAFARDLRTVAPRRYTDLYRTYGRRSYFYTEFVFGNVSTVLALIEAHPQQHIFAMRTSRAVSLAEVTRRTGLSVDEVRRFNPALVNQVPKGTNLYLPARVEEFGPDVTFWHRPANPAFASVLNEFLHLRATPEQWDDPAFDDVLDDFRRRFRETRTEEGLVMAAMLAYTMQALAMGRPILAEYRGSARIQTLFEQSVAEREASGR